LAIVHDGGPIFVGLDGGTPSEAKRQDIEVVENSRNVELEIRTPPGHEAQVQEVIFTRR
jgi:hypothetical protein